MATWKKVLVNGLSLTGTDVTNNTGDLVSSTGTTGIKVTNGTDVLLGNNTQVSVEVDIANVRGELLSGNANAALNAAGTDLLLISDTSASGAIKKVSLANAVGAVSSSVTSVQFTSDEAGQSTGTDQGAVSVKMEGGTGITTSIKTNDGDDVVLFTANDATDSVKGVATFDETDFDVVSGDVTIKDDAIKTALINNGAVTTAKLGAGAVNDGKINASGITTNGKVKFSALDFANADALAGTLGQNDTFIVDEGVSGDGTGNHKATLADLGTFLASSGQVANIDTMHSGVGPNTGSGQTITGSGTAFVKTITVDGNGHVTAVGQGTVQTASDSQAGLMSTSGQTFAGDKTFNGSVSVGTNLTVTGNLTIQGTTTTVDSTVLNVVDPTITLAALDSDSAAYALNNSGASAANNAADEAGIILQSHHGTDVAAFAALTWDKDANLSGWKVRDTATYQNNDPAQDVDQTNFEISVMQFKAGAPDNNTDDGAGVGSFLYDSSGDDLYIRLT